MEFTLNLCMPAIDMFENNDLHNEVCYAFEMAVNDGLIDLGAAENMNFSELCKRLNYREVDLTAEYCERDMGELYIYYSIPVTLDV